MKMFISIVSLFFMNAHCLAVDREADTLFGSCTQLQGQQYLDAVVRTLDGKDGAKNFMERVLASETRSVNDKCQARILLARLSHPEVFLEWREFLNALHKAPYYEEGVRPGMLCGEFLKFMNRGPESRYVDQRKNSGPGIGARNRCERVEKFSEEDVLKGKARNAAARYALVEHFLKFCQDVPDFEQIELIEVLWTLGQAKKNKEVDWTACVNAILLNAAGSDARNMPVRVHAVFWLAPNLQHKFCDLMLAAVRSEELRDNDSHHRTITCATKVLTAHADRKTLSVLEEMRGEPRWKQKLIDEAARDIAQRLSKENAGEQEKHKKDSAKE